MRGAFLAVALMLASACATSQNAPQLTPQARTDYNLRPVVDAIGTLQLAAEKAPDTIDHGKPLLPLNTARKIVQFTVDANTILGTANAGWCAEVGAAYRGLKHQMTGTELAAFSPYFTTFEAALAAAGCAVI